MVLLLGAAGCSQSSSPGVAGDSAGCGVDCGKSSAARSTRLGSSDGTSTSSSASASSGSSSGTTFGGSSSSGSSSSVSFIQDETSCEGIAVNPITATCASGTSFSSQTVDLLSCTVVGGAAIAAIDANGVPFPSVAATSESNGNFALCLPTGSPFSIEIQAPSYATTYYAEMLDPSSGGFAQMAMLSKGEIQAFQGLFPGGEQTDTALIVAKLTGDVCYPNLGGWTFDLALPDGGAIADGGYQLIYLGASGLPDATATSTSSKGAALFYNLDPALSGFLMLTAQTADAGSCQIINSGLGFTGRIFVAGNSITVEPFLLP